MSTDAGRADNAVRGRLQSLGVPRLCPSKLLDALLVEQDWVVTGAQAQRAGLTARAVLDRVQRNRWKRLLPDVYLAHPGEPSRRQLLIAALLYAGPDSAIDADDACAFHGLTSVRPDSDLVRVVVPQTSVVRSHRFVLVRRTSTPIRTIETGRLRYVEPAAGVVAAARLRSVDRRVLAILSEAVQRRVVTPDDLLRAHVQGPPRNAKPTARALEQLRAGVQSAPEGEFRLLAEASRVLPPLLYNRRLRLPSGAIVVPDALALDAGLVHETNGRRAHARDDLFEDMQVRHEAMTTAGLTVLHTSPQRLRRNGREVLVGFERCYARLRGNGLPRGVVLLPDRGQTTL